MTVRWIVWFLLPQKIFLIWNCLVPEKGIKLRERTTTCSRLFSLFNTKYFSCWAKAKWIWQCGYKWFEKVALYLLETLSLHLLLGWWPAQVNTVLEKQRRPGSNRSTACSNRFVTSCFRCPTSAGRAGAGSASRRSSSPSQSSGWTWWVPFLLSSSSPIGAGGSSLRS